MKFKELTDEDLRTAWEDASNEFPGLPALRDLHFIRYLTEKLNIPVLEEKNLEPELSEYIRERARYWMDRIDK